MLKYAIKCPCGWVNTFEVQEKDFDYAEWESENCHSHRNNPRIIHTVSIASEYSQKTRIPVSLLLNAMIGSYWNSWDFDSTITEGKEKCSRTCTKCKRDINYLLERELSKY